MTLSPQMEQAWLEDETIRLGNYFRTMREREYWRKRILDIEESYERKLLPMKKVERIPFTVTSACAFGKGIVKSMLP